MEYYCLLTILMLLHREMYADTTVVISIGFEIKSIHDQDDTLQCCFKLRNNKTFISLMWNTTIENSTVMLYNNINNSYTIYRNNSLLLQDAVLLRFDISNRCVIHISGNSTFTWRCGTELTVDTCLNSNKRGTKTFTTILDEVTKTTEMTGKYEKVTSNPISPGTNVFKNITIFLGAVILVLVTSMLILIFHCKRKVKANLHVETKPKSTRHKRQENHLEDVTFVPAYRNMEVQHETIAIERNIVQSNHNGNPCDSNKKNLSNVNNEENVTNQEENKRQSYGPKFYSCQHEEETEENIRTTNNVFLNETYSFMELENEHVQQRSPTKPISHDEISIDSEDLSDKENDKKYATQQKELSKPKRRNYRETVHIIPGKNSPIVMLKS